jgi:ribosomal protein S18 acetylase RimI-like enzyme
MAAIQIRPLDSLELEDFRRVMTGYVSPWKYAVDRTETQDGVAIRLQRVALSHLYVKEFLIPPEELRRYREVVLQGWSLGAYDGENLVGIALAERRDWNRSLWVWELGVAETQRRKGIARSLVEELSHRAREAGLRVLVCETQTTNVPAIDFYHNTGFHVDGIDLSYYTNEDAERGEVALFMKKRLD